MPRQDGCFVGIDLGTSGCRAIAIDAGGQYLSERRAPLPPSRRPFPGASEQSPAHWWQAVVAVLQGLVSELDRPVQAICVDGTSSTVALYDRAGRPCTSALMYDDRRATAEAERIAAVATAESAARGPNSALAKLLYLDRHAPAASAAHALHQADWISNRLLRRFGSSDENNALKLGFDPVTSSWPTWFEQLPIPRSRLPRIVPVATVLGPIDPRMAELTGLDPDCRIVAGTTDSNAAAIAAGIETRGDAVTSLGSTLVVKVLSDRPVADAASGVYSHSLLGNWLAGGASNSGGAVLRHFFDDEALQRLSDRIDPATDPGLDYYPLLQPGERFPVNDPELPPRLDPRPDDDVRFLHGLLLGIARVEKAGYDRLRELGAPYPSRVLSCGGGAHNPVWREIRERVLGVPVSVAAQAEAAFGAGLLARRAVS